MSYTAFGVGVYMYMYIYTYIYIYVTAHKSKCCMCVIEPSCLTWLWRHCNVQMCSIGSQLPIHRASIFYIYIPSGSLWLFNIAMEYHHL